MTTPKKMRPVEAWAVVNADGLSAGHLQVACDRDELLAVYPNRENAEKDRVSDDGFYCKLRIARVRIVEITKPKLPSGARRKARK